MKEEFSQKVLGKGAMSFIYLFIHTRVEKNIRLCDFEKGFAKWYTFSKKRNLKKNKKNHTRIHLFIQFK